MSIKTIVNTVTMILLPLIGFGQLSRQQERNLTAFAKIYGYVQYFHPSDESRMQDWESIAIAGSQQMLLVKNDDELLLELNKIFKPIAPTIKIFKSSKTEKFNLSELKPKNSSDYKEVSWQHLGFNLYSGILERPYKSIRLNRPPEIGNDRNMVIPLTGNYDISKFTGQDFEFSFTAHMKPGNQMPLELKVSHDKDTLSLINSLEPLTYRFRGKLDGRTNFLAFKLGVDPSLPISIEKPIFKVLDVEKNYVTEPLATSTIQKGAKIHDFTLEVIDLNYSLYKERLQVGDYIKKDLVSGLALIMPLVLYGDKTSTYPMAQSSPNMSGLSTDAKKKYYQISGFENIELRIADIIILWNILKHSFPYMDDVKVDQEKLLIDMTNKAVTAKSHVTYQEVIEQMCSYYNDAHMFVSIVGAEPAYTVPIALTLVRNRVIVRDVEDQKLAHDIIPGDIVVKIDNISIRKKINTLSSYLSGSIQKKRLALMQRILNGPKGSQIEITLSRKGKTHKIKVNRTIASELYMPGNSGYLKRNNGWLEPDTYYFDLTRNTLNESNFKVLKSAKSIIFDLRGYVFDQTISTDLIPALIRDTIKVNRFFNPKILYPDQEHLSYHVGEEHLQPDPRHQISGNIVFLTDASAVSASESIMGLVKDFRLATIFGEATAGTNGDVNIAYLPGGLVVYFSGMLVKNSDGSKHHIKGILPDIKVENSRKAIENREDLVLEKVIQYLHKRSGSKTTSKLYHSY